MAKDWAKGFYSSTTWRRQREYILKRDNYICTELNCHNVATEVHHVVELTEDNIRDINISLNENNLRSLCGECHKRITREMHQKDYGILEEFRFDADGYPVPLSQFKN